MENCRKIRFLVEKFAKVIFFSYLCMANYVHNFFG